MANEKVIVFQGDSVTDCGRNYKDPYELGKGYAMIAASLLAASDTDTSYTFYNRGISGNRVKDLRARWEEDCIALKPDVVSILIGINDCWRRYDQNDPTSTEQFESGYRELLEHTKQTGAEILLLEPFVLPYPVDREAWREDLDPKIQVVRKLAREFQAPLVPLDGLFASKLYDKPAPFWAEDGVHPTYAGHAIIAKAWRDAYQKLENRAD
ncbi:SGNH/GDSL hydrolase family protein [Pullulanibacillus sp. KACC 23026]|uniref:SGNH/GDSL hydrolase family protein n=1 Tax=Pullulanibacillus sp. KACC 23026 TaxID=3028315 RepID=UPI0023AF52EA|nr:SGNH/GDSL hydrolase family protein [Pullulanibacillus sp. KACC 23026]WEG13148.1 SGNH/GDSL hydrolase family protein [Pullulanibacillus sp. KACC 23026]